MTADDIKEELIDNLVERFDCSRLEAERVGEQILGYIDDKESSELTDQMKDPDYMPGVLEEKPPDYDSLKSRWNWWVGQFTQDGSQYQVDG